MTTNLIKKCDFCKDNNAIYKCFHMDRAPCSITCLECLRDIDGMYVFYFDNAVECKKLYNLLNVRIKTRDISLLNQDIEDGSYSNTDRYIGRCFVITKKFYETGDIESLIIANNGRKGVVEYDTEKDYPEDMFVWNFVYSNGKIKGVYHSGNIDYALKYNKLNFLVAISLKNDVTKEEMSIFDADVPSLETGTEIVLQHRPLFNRRDGSYSEFRRKISIIIV